MSGNAPASPTTASQAAPSSAAHAATLARQAQALAAQLAEAQERVEALRRLRDRAIVGLVEAGWSTRTVGRELGLTATQVSTIWCRHRPPRGPGRVSAPRG